MSTLSIAAGTRRAVGWGALLVVLLASTAAAGPYKEGQPVEITGVVTGVDGMPVEAVRVVLESSRKAFSFKHLSRTTSEVRKLATETSARGEFTLRWLWHDYFNHFELLVGVPERGAGGKEELRVLERSDLSRTILHGSPVVANLTVADTAFLTGLREFVASADSKDELQIYHLMGRPDRVETFDYPDFEEVSWWYFASGKAYRFREGKLEQVVHFEPVEPFDPD
jgi:hypothetical protein